MKAVGRLLLGVNIDHVATVREARGVSYPDPVYAALEAERAGADGITLHVREDKRHVNERDLERVLELCQIPVNLEIGLQDTIIKIAEKHKPPYVCFVPEKREELTTEGGLDVIKNFARIKDMVKHFSDHDIIVSLFVDPHPQQIEAAFETGAPFIEIHTGYYANTQTIKAAHEELIRIEKAASIAFDMGLKINAGHGLHFHNVLPIAKIPNLVELNIGHAIIANAIIEGMYHTVLRMKQLLQSIA